MFKVDLVFGMKVEVHQTPEKIVKKYNLPPQQFEYANGRALHLTKNGTDRFIIYLGVDTYETIAHEATHITTNAMELYDIKDEEFRAYLTGWLVDQIIYKLRKIDATRSKA